MGTQRVPWEGTVKSESMPRTSVFGLSAASATQAYALGTEVLDDSGYFGSWSKGAIYRYVKDSGSGVTLQTVVGQTVTPHNVVTAPATQAGVQSRCGIAVQTLTASQYGWICVHGPCMTIYSATGFVLGDLITPDVGSAGAVIEVAVVNTNAGTVATSLLQALGIMGFALEAEAATTASRLKVFLQGLR